LERRAARSLTVFARRRPEPLHVRGLRCAQSVAFRLRRSRPSELSDKSDKLLDLLCY